MTDLRKAAEMALEALDIIWATESDFFHYQDEIKSSVQALRQALAHEALDRMVAENQRLGLYDEDLQTAIEKGTKAWADVPDATEWVDELRGNVDNVYMSEKRVHKSDKSIHELVDWEAVAADQAMTIAMMQIENKREWVALTDEEVSHLADSEWEEAFVRLVEAKLKEKNT